MKALLSINKQSILTMKVVLSINKQSILMMMMFMTALRMEQKRREADESCGGKRCKEGVQHSVQESHGTIQVGTSRTLHVSDKCTSGIYCIAPVISSHPPEKHNSVPSLSFSSVLHIPYAYNPYITPFFMYSSALFLCFSEPKMKYLKAK